MESYEIVSGQNGSSGDDYDMGSLDSESPIVEDIGAIGEELGEENGFEVNDEAENGKASDREPENVGEAQGEGDGRDVSVDNEGQVSSDKDIVDEEPTAAANQQVEEVGVTDEFIASKDNEEESLHPDLRKRKSSQDHQESSE